MGMTVSTAAAATIRLALLTLLPSVRTTTRAHLPSSAPTSASTASSFSATNTSTSTPASASASTMASTSISAPGSTSASTPTPAIPSDTWAATSFAVLLFAEITRKLRYNCDERRRQKQRLCGCYWNFGGSFRWRRFRNGRRCRRRGRSKQSRFSLVQRFRRGFDSGLLLHRKRDWALRLRWLASLPSIVCLHGGNSLLGRVTPRGIILPLLGSQAGRSRIGGKGVRAVVTR